MPRPTSPKTEAEETKAASSIAGFIARYEKAPVDEDVFRELGKKFHVWRCALPLSDLTSDPIAIKRSQGYEFAQEYCTNQEIVMILPLAAHRALLDKFAKPILPAPNAKTKTGSREEEFEVESLSIAEIEAAEDLGL